MDIETNSFNDNTGPFVERRSHVSVPSESTIPKDNVFLCAAETIPPFRRAVSVKDDMKKGEYLPALGAVALTAINLPEDLRDIGSAKEQIHSFIKGEEFKGAYDYKNFQHEFSFFRGTLLQPLVDSKNAKNPEFAEKLYKLDQSLLKTDFGKSVLSFLKVGEEDFEEVKKRNKETGLWEVSKDINDKERYAKSFNGGTFGKMTARAMARTTLIGTAIFAALELPKILHSTTEGDNLFENAENTTKQVFKSGINIASITAGIAYGGAYGSKYGKCFGSLVGMGIGAVLGTKASHKLQDAI